MVCWSFATSEKLERKALVLCSMFNYLQRNIYVFNRAKVNDGMLPIFALPPDFFRVRAKYIFSFLLGVLKQKDCFS